MRRGVYERLNQTFHQENLFFSYPFLFLIAVLGAVHSELSETEPQLILGSLEPDSPEPSRDQIFLLVETVASSQRGLLA